MNAYKVNQLPSDYMHPYWGDRGGYWIVEGPEGVVDGIFERDIEDAKRIAQVLNDNGLDIIKANSEYRCA